MCTFAFRDRPPILDADLFFSTSPVFPVEKLLINFLSYTKIYNTVASSITGDADTRKLIGKRFSQIRPERAVADLSN